MSRRALACSLLLGLASCTRGERHVHDELAFLVPYIDVDREEEAVRGIFAQRRLLVEDTLRGEGYVALSAASLDRSKSAVRVITRRGVAVGEDGDTQDWFALARVDLLPSLPAPDARQALVGVLKTARGRADGCVDLYRLLPDGRALPVSMHVERLGASACVSELRGRGDGSFDAYVAWPELATLGSLRIELPLAFEEPRVGAAPELSPPLRVIEDSDWLDRESARLAPEPPASAPFSARHGLGVARAALALASGRSTDQQLAAYYAVLGRFPPGSPEAEIARATGDHIEQGWSNEPPEPPEPGTPIEPAPEPDPDALVIEPAAP